MLNHQHHFHYLNASLDIEINIIISYHFIGLLLLKALKTEQELIIQLTC